MNLNKLLASFSFLVHKMGEHKVCHFKQTYVKTLTWYLKYSRYLAILPRCYTFSIFVGLNFIIYEIKIWATLVAVKVYVFEDLDHKYLGTC